MSIVPIIGIVIIPILIIVIMTRHKSDKKIGLKKYSIKSNLKDDTILYNLNVFEKRFTLSILYNNPTIIREYLTADSYNLMCRLIQSNVLTAVPLHLRTTNYTYTSNKAKGVATFLRETLPNRVRVENELTIALGMDTSLFLDFKMETLKNVYPMLESLRKV